MIQSSPTSSHLRDRDTKNPGSNWDSKEEEGPLPFSFVGISGKLPQALKNAKYHQIVLLCIKTFLGQVNENGIITFATSIFIIFSTSTNAIIWIQHFSAKLH
jgi:hypothetical protein